MNPGPGIASRSFNASHFVHGLHERHGPMRGVQGNQRKLTVFDSLYNRASHLGGNLGGADVPPPGKDIALIERVAAQTLLGIVQTDGFHGDTG
jgi:hypothetical protein